MTIYRLVDDTSPLLYETKLNLTNKNKLFMKHFTKNLKWLLMSLMLVTGLGNAWGESSTVTASKITSASASWTGSQNETWSVSVTGGATNQNVTNGYAQIGTRANPSTSITFSTSGISKTITKIEVDCASYNGLGTLNATVGGESFGTQGQSTASWSNSTGGIVTFNGSASGTIVITMTNGSNGRAMYIKSITVTYTTGGGNTQTADVQISNTSLTVGETTTVTTNGPAVSLTTSNSSVASVNGTTVTAEGAGEATITATWPAGTVNGTSYSAGSKEFSVTVTAPFEITDGYFDFTVGEDYGSGRTTTTSTNPSVISSTWTAGNITLTTDGRNSWFEASGGTNLRLYKETSSAAAGNITLTAPSGYIITSIVFTGSSLGNITPNIGTYENDTWSGSSNSVTFTASNTTQINTITVTYEAGTSKVDPIFEWSSTTTTATVGQAFTAPTLSNNSDGDVTYNSSNTSVATIDANGIVTILAAGETTITASVSETNNYNAATASYTLTVNSATTPTGGYDDITYDFVGVTGTSYTNWSSKTGASGSVYAGNTAGGNSAVQMRSNQNNSGIVSTTSGGKLVKVTVTWNSNTSDGRTLNIYGSNTAYTSASDLYNSSTQGTLLGTIVKGTSTELTISGDYAYIGIRSASGALYTDNIRIEWTNPDSRTETTTTFNGNAEYVLNIEDEFNAPTATLSTEVGTLTYSSSNTDVATVNASTGEVTIVGKGTATITASYAGNETYKPSQASYNIYVIYTVEEAIAYINTLGSNTSPEKVCVRGKVSQVDSYNSTYGSITYWISDDGTTTNQMEVYGGLGLESAQFSQLSDIQTGDEVVVCGYVKLYNSEVHEFDKNNYLVEFYRPGTVVVPAPVFSPESGSSFSEAYDVTISTEDGLTIYYITQDNKIYKTETGKSATRSEASLDSNGNPILVSTAVEYSGALTFGQSMMVTAVAVDADGNQSDPVTATYTYTGSLEPPYFSSFSASAGDFTNTSTTDGPEWKLNSNTGADAIANWGEERYYMYVRGTSANTNETRERWYGTADFSSPMINLTDKANATFSFIHAGHHFYVDPNESSTEKSNNYEKTLSSATNDNNAKILQACHVFIDDYGTDGSSLVQSTEVSSQVNWFNQYFRTDFTDGVDNTKISSSYTGTGRGGQFPRANSGDISLSAYENHFIKIRFSYTSSSTSYGTWNIDQITINATNAEALEMNAKGWTTYVFDHDIDAYQTTLNYTTNGKTLKIYKVTEFDFDEVVLQQLGMYAEPTTEQNSERYIPALTPVVIEGPANKLINFVRYESSSMLPTVKNNLLYGSLETTGLVTATENTRYFVMQFKADATEPYFNKLKAGRSVPDHKAYLNGVDEINEVSTKTNSVKGIFVLGGDGEDEATGIISLDENNTVLSNEWFTLQGVRIERPTQKGIYILNGKKVLVK